jgi:hypothetical protein
MNVDAYEHTLSNLRSVLAKFNPGQKTYDAIVAPRDQVFAKYQPMFSIKHATKLSHDEFTSFLYFENNRHWSGLYRKGLGAATDMEKLRHAIGVLLDESRPIRERLPEALGMVTGLGRGIATAILTVAYPDKYGVWNNTSEGGLQQAGIWPDFAHGDGVGGRYEKINSLLKRLSSDLGTDLWTLDALWWFLMEPDEESLPNQIQVPDIEQVSEGFALERQLEDFLLENWDKTPLGKEWAILSTPDNPEAGNQYPTTVGPIDILAKHKTEPRYLVIELKRNQSNDKTIAQALRYVGWVKHELAKNGETVEALIIARKLDKAGEYAVSMLPQFRLMSYEVEFRLKAIEPLKGE